MIVFHVFCDSFDFLNVFHFSSLLPFFSFLFIFFFLVFFFFCLRFFSFWEEEGREGGRASERSSERSSDRASELPKNRFKKFGNWCDISQTSEENDSFVFYGTKNHNLFF